MSPDPLPVSVGLDRRRWLAAVASAAVLGASPRQDPPDDAPAPDAPGVDDAERAGIEAIAEHARSAGITGLRPRSNSRYVGLTTARDDFLAGALRLCEGLADDYLDHFRGLGFAVEPPPHRLFLVALANLDEFERFLGEQLGPDMVGVYETGPNWLILFDNRDGGARGAERANTITLFHEATHQLTFNTGLLDRDVVQPLLIAEGLALYGEVRRPDGRTKVGAVNRERLAVIGQELRRGRPLIPLADLLVDDGLFDREDTLQLAYAQSWLFLHGLLQGSRSRDRIRAYLDALRDPASAGRRLEIATEHFGELGRLDDQMLAYARRLLR